MNLEVPKQGVVVYCPECRHEAYLARERDVHCGQCHVKFGRRVQMLVDSRAGSLLGEAETASPEWAGYEPEA